MRLLMTGASSFTGYWFAKALHEAGHEVVALLRSAPGEYEAVRRERVMRLRSFARIRSGCLFGDERFLQFIAQEGPFDLLCHHAADVANFKSSDFNPWSALENNSRNLPVVLETLKKAQCSKILLTGSVFEAYEGRGRPHCYAFSPYGLSKGLTWELFSFYAHRAGVQLGKFVIPNPFGPLDKPAFTDYLIRSWQAGEIPQVRTPDYIRDNIHVSLLALAYRNFAERLLVSNRADMRYNPSGYVGSQGAFAQRFAKEMEERLPFACPVELMQQTDFSEPLERVNTELVDGAALGWRERDAWDAIAEYYGGVPCLAT